MTAPEGPISLAQDYLRLTLAASPTFQTLVGAANATAALAHIYHDALPPPHASQETHTREELENLRPYAIVYTAEQAGLRLQAVAMSDGFEFADSGSLRMQLQQNTPDDLANDPGEAELRWKNTIGKILVEMCERAGTPGYLAFHAVEIEDGPYRLHPDDYAEKGDAQGIDLAFWWGNA